MALTEKIIAEQLEDAERDGGGKAENFSLVMSRFYNWMPDPSEVSFWRGYGAFLKVNKTLQLQYNLSVHGVKVQPKFDIFTYQYQVTNPGGEYSYPKPVMVWSSGGEYLRLDGDRFYRQHDVSLLGLVSIAEFRGVGRDDFSVYGTDYLNVSSRGNVFSYRQALRNNASSEREYREETCRQVKEVKASDIGYGLSGSAFLYRCAGLQGLTMMRAYLKQYGWFLVLSYQLSGSSEVKFKYSRFSAVVFK
ncbi:hypothetical protein [uncultured Aquitalea sp.]|uniref:hypothetical protein n=1 Tax=uncultured Aquitalea sp. TaxID=540272 RepID=UPI0025D51DDE|nr:hypothetical protein [uncultured Aquitalea sp.]